MADYAIFGIKFLNAKQIDARLFIKTHYDNYASHVH